MPESLLHGIKLAAIVAATALLFGGAPALDLPGGLTLLVVLFAFDSGSKSMAQSFAFACTGAFAATVAFLPVYSPLLSGLNLGVPVVYVAWFVALLAIFLIDRAMNRSSPAPVCVPLYAPPATTYTATAASPAPVVQAPRSEPIQPILVRDEPAPAQPSSSVPASAPPEPFPGAIALKGGKQVDIYVNLLGEGMNMLRSVKAESLGRDYYHIIDVMPDNERWEFKPGQVVRCQKKNLSSGKALVAVDEAPRAQ